MPWAAKLRLDALLWLCHGIYTGQSAGHRRALHLFYCMRSIFSSSETAVSMVCPSPSRQAQSLRTRQFMVNQKSVGGFFRNANRMQPRGSATNIARNITFWAVEVHGRRAQATMQ
jgi:hypothetical protein